MLEDIIKINAIYESTKKSGIQMSERQDRYYNDTTFLISLIDKYKEDSLKSIYDITVLQLKLDQANQTIEAYRAMLALEDFQLRKE